MNDTTIGKTGNDAISKTEPETKANEINKEKMIANPVENF